MLQFNIIDTIPIIISTISLIISVIIVFRTWWSERFTIDFNMVKWFGSLEAGHPIFIWLYITNNSKLPCSVLEVKIHNERGGKVAEASGTGNKKLVWTKTTTGRDSEVIYSQDYPARVEPYGSIGGYFHVISKYGFWAFEEDDITIKIITSRGTRSKKVFMDYGKNVLRVMQHLDSSNKNLVEKRADGSTIIFIDDIDQY